MSTGNSFLSFLVLSTAAGVIISCQSENQINFARYYVAGKSLYVKHCQNCHGTKGEGLGALVLYNVELVNRELQECK